MDWKAGWGTATVAACLAVTLGTATARANDDARQPRSIRPLSGDYGFTSTQTCVRTPFQAPPAAGFDPATKQLLAPGEVVEATSMGVMSFEPDGTVTISEGVLVEVLLNQLAVGQTPVQPQAEFSCHGTYTIPATDQVSMTLSCDVASRGPGVTVTLGPLSFDGFVGPRRETINLSLLKNEIQTIAVSVNGNLVQERHRICTQSASLVKL